MSESAILKMRIKDAQKQQKEAVSRHIRHGNKEEAQKVAKGYRNFIIHLYLTYIKIKP